MSEDNESLQQDARSPSSTVKVLPPLDTSPRVPPRPLYCHLALATAQLIFAASMTIVRSAFIGSDEVSPIIIATLRLLLCLTAFTIIHFVRMFQRRRRITATRLASLSDLSNMSTCDASPGKSVGDAQEDAVDESSTAASKGVDDVTGGVDEFHDLSRGMKLRCVGLGIAGSTFNMMFAATGIKYAGAITTGAMQCVIPPLTCFIAFLFCNETLSVSKIVGLVLAVGGNLVMMRVWCVFVTSESCGNTDDDASATSDMSYYFGCVAVLIGVTAYSSYLVFQRPVVKLLPKGEFLFRTFLYGFVGMLIVVLVRIDLVWHQLTTPGIITQDVLFAIAFAGLVNSTFAYYLVSVGISGVSPAAAAIYFCLQPLFVCVFSTVFLGEGVSLLQAAGGVLVIAGMLASVVQLPGSKATDGGSEADGGAQEESSSIFESPRHADVEHELVHSL